MSKDLIDKILKASDLIHNQSLKGGANYIVTSSNVSNYMNKSFRCYNRKIKIIRIFNEKI